MSLTQKDIMYVELEITTVKQYFDNIEKEFKTEYLALNKTDFL